MILIDELVCSNGDELSVRKGNDKNNKEKHTKRKSIVELFDGYKDNYVPQEIDWGEDIGKEIIK